ncbi:MAG: Asp23/Gls24 family envelope stress response protein [Chloroflexota bacterium]
MAENNAFEVNEQGQIDISTTAIASIVSHAVNQCYGVVGMANKSIVNGIAQLLAGDSNKGIDVTINDSEVVVDVYVIVEYGIRIRAVAESIQNTVKFNVEKALNREVNAVNVFIQGLRHAPN